MKVARPLKLSFFILSSALASLQTKDGAGQDMTSGLDTNRDAAALDVDKFRREGEYRSTFSVRTEMDMEVSGMQIHAVTDMDIEIDMKVADRPDGSHQVDMTYQGVSLSTSQGSQTLYSCAWMTAEDRTKHLRGDDPVCDPFYELLGKEVTLEVDDRGNVVDPAAGGSSTTSGGATPSNAQLQDTSGQVMATNRYLVRNPSHPVAPGDSWDVDESFPDGTTLTGHATLLGYKTYQGNDVAVIQIKGVETIDIKKLSQQFGGSMGDALKDVSVSDIDLTATMYFDPNVKFVRLMSVEQDYTLRMKMFDGSDVTAPIRQEATLDTDQV